MYSDFMRYVIILLAFLTSCSGNAQNQVIKILNSKDIFTEEHKWIVQSVELRPDCTIVEKYVCPLGEEPTWIFSNRSEFIEDAITGEKYYLTGSEIGTEDGKTLLHDDTRTFKEYYPPLPEDIELINISAGSKYYVNSVNLSQKQFPILPPVSKISFLGLYLGSKHKTVIDGLTTLGFTPFFTEKDKGMYEEDVINTYLQGNIDNYNVTIELTTNLEYEIVSDVKIMYHNHIDTYEVDEHLQMIADEIKSTYQYRKFEDRTPAYQQAADMLNMKSGKNGIFKNITINIFDGLYRIYESSSSEKNDFYGTINIEVHRDDLHHDHVILVDYTDHNLNTYIRRSTGAYQW